jgi:EAL domain-containing protein (putative c-di-GMP-specific phosphodiesterase class I)
MLAQACGDAASLLRDGLDIGRVSVNLSAEQLYNNQLVAEIQTLLKMHGLPGTHLELEVIEEVISRDFELVNMQLSKLREAGIGISVDDFGTGYSSLSRLKLLPVQKIKIDKSFIDGLPYSGNDASIVRSIIALGRALAARAGRRGGRKHGTINLARARRCRLSSGLSLRETHDRQ